MSCADHLLGNKTDGVGLDYKKYWRLERKFCMHYYYLESSRVFHPAPFLSGLSFPSCQLVYPVIPVLLMPSLLVIQFYFLLQV